MSGPAYKDSPQGRYRRLIIEILGTPGAGKSSLATALGAHVGETRWVRTYLSGRNLLPWVRSGAALLPLLLSGSFSGPSPIRGRIWAVRISASHVILERASADERLLFFDQGPLFTMLRLMETGVVWSRGHRWQRWWQREVSEWAGALDVAVVLDAPDDVLLHRIRNRAKPHALKGGPEREARTALAKWRAQLELLISELQGHGEVEVVRLDTGGKLVGEVEARLMSALGLDAAAAKGSAPKHEMSSAGTVRVISIGGASRSGSTLLAALLGRTPGSIAVGELRYIWSRGYMNNELCGCGEPFRECDFWRTVLHDVYGGMERVPIAEVMALHRSVAEMRHLPQLMISKKARRFEARFRDYLAHLGALVSSIANVSGSNTVIDSSKLPPFCYLLSCIPNVDAQLLHLTRDSRAVAFSFMRTVRKPEVRDREEYMRRFSPLRSARDWNVINLGMEMIRRSSVRCDFVRYEDLVADLPSTLSRLLSQSGDATDILGHGGVLLPHHHMVAGNPVRFTKGSLSVRADTEWRQRMGRQQFYVVTALTLPLLARYGYI